MVIGTGNVPLDLVEAESTRDLFFDGPLQELTEARWTKEVAPLASANWAKYIGYSGIGEMSKEARAKLVGMIDAVCRMSLKLVCLLISTLDRPMREESKLAFGENLCTRCLLAIQCGSC